MSEARLVGLTLGETAASWRAAGFTVSDAGDFAAGTLGFDASGLGGGVAAWQLDGVKGPAEVDGLATSWVSQPELATTTHPNGVTALDHLVIGSPDRERTIAAFGAQLGLAPRRQTEHRLYGRTMVQTFFLLSPTLLEVISRPDDRGDGPSVFWGLAFVTQDIDATVAALDGACSPPKDAVQPGRRIATLDHEALGLATPVAFLTPRR